MTTHFPTTAAFAAEMDRADPLREFHTEFAFPDEKIYLDGNSLGLLCQPAELALKQAVSEWKQFAIEGWLDASPPWFDLAEQLGARLAPLIGAAAEEVIVANSTTVNLHQLLATFYDPTSSRPVILADELCFPSDRYALESFLRLVGRNPDDCLRLVPSRDGWTLDEEEIIDRIAPDVQLVILPSVVFSSGQLLDVARLACETHRRGCLIGLDCSHSVGLVPHRLHEHDVDFAFFCTYKYLNGGPGAPGAIYLNRRHFDRPAGLAGWFGSDKDRQFEMSATFHQTPSAGGLQIGTPSILASAPLGGSLDLIERAGIDRIREKSVRLTSYLRQLIASKLGDDRFDLVPASEHIQRGGHVGVTHSAGRGVAAALRNAGVVPDFRPPTLIRLAPVPLYTSFQECYRAVEIMEKIVRTGQYRHLGAGDERVP